MSPFRTWPGNCPTDWPDDTMLKIERSVEGGAVHLVLTGRIDLSDLEELERAIDGAGVVPSRVTLDLAEVRLLDREAVRFLARCEAAGARLIRCPPFIREWMTRERESL
jgi:hypothetical protein